MDGYAVGTVLTEYNGGEYRKQLRAHLANNHSTRNTQLSSFRTAMKSSNISATRPGGARNHVVIISSGSLQTTWTRALFRLPSSPRPSLFKSLIHDYSIARHTHQEFKSCYRYAYVARCPNTVHRPDPSKVRPKSLPLYFSFQLTD